MKYDDFWFGALSQSAINGLDDYYSEFENLLLKEKSLDMSRRMKQVGQLHKKQKLSEEQLMSEYSLSADEHEYRYEMFFTNYFRYSVVILVYLILEDHLNKYCSTLYKLKKHDKKPSKNIYKINEYKDYISGARLAEYDNSIWDFIEDLKIIRNCIVHQSGDISRLSDEKQKIINNIIEKDIGIRIGHDLHQTSYSALYMDYDSLIIEPKFCEKIIKDLKTLLITLCNASGIPLEIKFEISKK